MNMIGLLNNSRPEKPGAKPETEVEFIVPNPEHLNTPEQPKVVEPSVAGLSPEQVIPIQPSIAEQPKVVEIPQTEEAVRLQRVEEINNMLLNFDSVLDQDPADIMGKISASSEPTKDS
jgi:hypothetical protein